MDTVWKRSGEEMTAVVPGGEGNSERPAKASTAYPAGLLLVSTASRQAFTSHSEDQQLADDSIGPSTPTASCCKSASLR